MEHTSVLVEQKRQGAVIAGNKSIIKQLLISCGTFALYIAHFLLLLVQDHVLPAAQFPILSIPLHCGLLYFNYKCLFAVIEYRVDGTALWRILSCIANILFSLLILCTLVVEIITIIFLMEI